MTKKEASDLAFEKTIEYIRSLDSRLDGKPLSLIARAIGHYETKMDELSGEIS